MKSILCIIWKKHPQQKRILF